jgi:SpoVK/Ycf46/Vps4 family AAA+-type ATPase
MSFVDEGLVVPVRRFVAELSPIVAEVAKAVPSVRVDLLHRDVVTEAFNVAAGFIDSDDRHTDAELWALAAAFGPLLDTPLAGATPAALREAGVVNGKRDWLQSPSVLFDILVKTDARSGSSHARTYYDRAMEIAFTIASLDAMTSTAELEAIERFRGMLLAAMTTGRPSVLGVDSGAIATTTTPRTPGAAEVEPARPLDELLAELDELVGMTDVKREIKLVANLIWVEKLRRDRDLPVLEQSRHLIFTGNPGTGKTTVARLLAQIYRTLGVVAKGHLVETDRSQLVAGYVGQTAIQVRKVFDEADEGVLLIDEAYALVRGGERDFGREAIDTIVKLVEDRRESIVVIAAGYPDEMAEFVAANPGLRSRFPKTIFFPDYSDDELWRIFELLAKKGGYRCDDAAREKVQHFFAAQPRNKGFGNGRLARNLFEFAVANQATRIVELSDPTDDELQTLTAADIPEAVPLA